MVAEWLKRPLHSSTYGSCQDPGSNPARDTMTKKLSCSYIFYSALSAASDALMRLVRCIGSEAGGNAGRWGYAPLYILRVVSNAQKDDY